MTKWDDIQKWIEAVEDGKVCPLLPRDISVGELVKVFFPELTQDGVFDYALPLSWTDEVEKVTGRYPRNFVWFYPKGELVEKYGASEFPYPLTKRAMNLLEEYNKKTGYNYPVPSE